jgi:hypothetical protein
VVVRERIGPHGGIKTKFVHQHFRSSFADPVDVLESDFHSFISGQVDARDTCHFLSLPLFMLRIFTDNADHSATLENLTLFADSFD